MYYDYQYVTEQQCSKENEAVMEALVSGNEDNWREVFALYKDGMDAHKICKNGTTIACAAVKTRNLCQLKAVLEVVGTKQKDSFLEQRSPKRLRTTVSNIDFPRRDASNAGCLYRSNLDPGVCQFYRFTYGIEDKGKISQLDNYGRNCLHYAILEEQLDMVEYLLKNFTELNPNQVDRSVKSPLHLAVEKENKELVKLLLKLGATVDLRDNEGKSPLHNASEKGSIKMIELLLEAKSDINALDFSGQSTLILATIYDQCDAVELLVKRGVKVNYEDDQGFTALKRAIYVKNSQVTKILIQNGARICESEFFLHRAAMFNQFKIAESLVDGGARLETMDGKGKTPLMYAIEYKHFEMAKYLLEKGASPNTTNGHSGTTSLHISMFYIHEKGIIEPFIDMLLKYGADVYTKCNFGYDALYYAFMHKNDAGACHLTKIMDVNRRYKVVRLDYLSSCIRHSEGTEPIKYLMHAGFNLENYVFGKGYPRALEDMNAKEKYLHDFLCKPFSLKEWCRIHVRRACKPADLSQLSIPLTLHKFLNLEDL